MRPLPRDDISALRIEVDDDVLRRLADLERRLAEIEARLPPEKPRAPEGYVTAKFLAALQGVSLAHVYRRFARVKVGSRVFFDPSRRVRNE